MERMPYFIASSITKPAIVVSLRQCITLFLQRVTAGGARSQRVRWLSDGAASAPSWSAQAHPRPQRYPGWTSTITSGQPRIGGRNSRRWRAKRKRRRSAARQRRPKPRGQRLRSFRSHSAFFFFFFVILRLISPYL